MTNCHDQLLYQVLMEMMVNLDDLDKIHMFHKSDNCFNQYKCVKHFYHLQCIVNKFNKNIIHAYGVAEHGHSL